MNNGLQDWITICMNEMPHRKHVMRFNRSFISYNSQTRQGVIRIAINQEPPDLIICQNLFEHYSYKYNEELCLKLHAMLSNDGIILVEFNGLDPGIFRYWLKPFRWRYITAVPKIRKTFAIAGKGIQYYTKELDENGRRHLRRINAVK